MTRDSKSLFPDAEHFYNYQNPLGFTLFWFLWSFLGYFYMIFLGDPNSSLDWVYLFSSILAVMALSNRKYGVNHTIRFYNDHIIVPRLINTWFWKEERISYKEIDELDYVDYGEGTSKDFCEITLKTKAYTYPILGKKLSMEDFKNIFTALQEKTKIRVPQLPDFVEANEGIDRKISSEKKTTGFLAILAIFVSGLTIIGISISSKYSDIMSGEKIFLSSFLVSLALIIALIFFVKKKISNDNGKLGWKKIFLIGYIWFYGGISLTFCLIFINGYFSFDEAITVNVEVQKTLVRKSRKGKCVGVVKNFTGVSRVPSSEVTPISICNNAFDHAKVGDKYSLKIKKGLFNEGWISDMVKANKN